MRTVGEIMDANKGVAPGFDLLRVALSLAVILRHCFPITYGSDPAANAGALWAASMGILPMFFILSGFLVTGSALRLTLGKFVLSRVLRIVPALVVDTLVTVLLIGPIFTSQTLADYFASPVTHAYLLNMVGEIHYFLPGVFERNPLAGVVNGALWTIPPELGCYVFMAALILFGWVRDWRKVAIIALLSIVAIVVVTMAPLAFPPVVGKVAAYQGALLVPEFLIGSLLYLKRHLIPYSAWLFAGCVALVVISGFLLPETAFSTVPLASLFAVPVYAYLTVFLGATKMPELPLFRRGDYSYGIYLYGFPIQQAIVNATGVHNPVLLFFMTLPPVIGLAMLSWHLVEKPTLKLRKGFSMSARREKERQQRLDAEAHAEEMQRPSAGDGPGAEAVSTPDPA